MPELTAGTPGTTNCNCSDPDCPRIICITCGCSDCKWPSECKGKCRECGEPARPCGLPNSEGMFDCYCSEACQQIGWDQGIADGTILSMADLTPEQTNEMFNKIGLGLVGVGPRKPS